MLGANVNHLFAGGRDSGSFDDLHEDATGSREAFKGIEYRVDTAREKALVLLAADFNQKLVHGAFLYLAVAYRSIP